MKQIVQRDEASAGDVPCDVTLLDASRRGHTTRGILEIAAVAYSL